MPSTPHDDIMIDAASSAVRDAYPFVRHRDDHAIIAVRAGRPIHRTEFLSDIAALAAQLPSHNYTLNLCADRYRFMVGLGAALVRRQVSLMPPSDAPVVLQDLAADYPDLYALTDGADPPIPTMVFPDRLEHSRAGAEPPGVPGEQPAIILFTSGSTGRPKAASKSWGALVRSALSAGHRLDVANLAGATVIGTVPHQHSYGFESTILLGLQHGLIVEAGRPLYPGDIRAAIEEAPRPRILVTTPVHLRALVADCADMPPIDLILSATAPLPVELAAQAEARMACRLVEIYGCTEAGQLATRRTVQETQWRCFDGVRLCQDESGTWASGPAVEGEVLLHDVIEHSGADTFLLGGRPTDLVDVAGKRTSLAHLNHQLLSIEGVKDGVFLMGDATGDRIARLMALVVAPGMPLEAIMRGLRERMDAAFLPRPLVLVEALPRNASGKIPREALLEHLRRDPSA